MTHLTLAVASKTFFDADVDWEANEIGDSFNEVLSLFHNPVLL
jgi:hypothetical protein